MGIASNSLFRIRAGVVHTISDNTEKTGNTFIYKKQLIEAISNLLGLNTESNEDKFNEVLDDMGYDKTLTIFRAKNGQEIVMLTRMYFTESSVAQKLALLNITAKRLLRLATELFAENSRSAVTTRRIRHIMLV